MCIWIHDKYSSTSFKQRLWQRKIVWYDKINFANQVWHCDAVVKELLERALFSVSLYRFFFSCLVSFLNTVFPFGLFFFILTADPAGHALGSIYIFSLSPEFYFGNVISKALDLHTGQAYDQKKKKHKLSRHVPPLKQLNFFNVSWHHDKQHTVHHKLQVYTQYSIKMR